MKIRNFVLALPCLCPTLAAEFPEMSPPPRLVGLATPTEECAEDVFYGLQDILLGWDESAHARFSAAVEADEGCAVAQLGLLLTSGDSPNSSALAALESAIHNELAMTPAEAALLSTGLVLLSGDRSGAAQEFRERIKKWRADLLSACWAVLLLHDGYDETGKPLPNQAAADELIQQLWLKHRANHPCSAIVCYLRALMEETAPTISQDALQSAAHAANLLPQHPSPQLLLGHLLLRSGRVHESIPYFAKAAELAKAVRVSQGETPDSVPYAWPLEIRARLYEATALWMDGQFDDALKARRMLNALDLDAAQLDSPGALLLRWEARTLPLRILVLRPEIPYDGEIKAATQVATSALKDDPVHHLRDCLRFCLVARQRAKASKRESAVKCIEAAQKAYDSLLARGNELGQGRGASSWARACEACEVAINAAKAATYSSTAEIWEENCRRAMRPSTLLMPPVIPQISLNSAMKQ